MATETAKVRTARTGTTLVERLAELDSGSYSPQTARIFLKVGFSRAEQRRVDQLSEKARQGTLTPAEEQELDDCIHVGHLLAIVQSKARRALKRPRRPA